MKITNVMEFLLIALVMGILKSAAEMTPEVTTKAFISATARLRKCSTVLSDFLEELCYENIIVVKRDSSPLLRMLTPPTPKARFNRAPALRRLRRSKGIISECCERMCTVEHLLLYCPDVSPAYSRINDNT